MDQKPKTKEELKAELLQELGQLHLDQADLHGRINHVYKEIEALKKTN